MITVLRKVLMVGALSFLTIAAAHANWQCRMSNGRHMQFYGVGVDKRHAAANAMYQCSGRGTSTYAAACNIDWCRSGFFAPNGPAIPPVSGGGMWRCWIANKAGGQWVATATTRKAAAARAMYQCAGRFHSNYAKNCSVSCKQL